MEQQRSFLCKCHPDFHIPPDVVVGEGFDGDAYARRLKAAHVDAVAFFAKCHYGHSYYPTEVGYVHPGLCKDMLREVVDGCRPHGLGVVAYYSTFIDTHAAAEHPDWVLRDKDGQARAGHFTAVCVNSPYVEELLVPQCVEMVSKYEVDELLLDTMSWAYPCHCEHCRRMFGQEIPTSPEDPQWLEYVQWYKRCFDEFFTSVPDAIHEAAPRVAVCHNWKYSIRLPETAPPSVDRLIGDSQVSSAAASVHCRYWAGTGLPFDYMVGRFAHGLGDWSSAPPDRLKAIAATSVANGGGFYIIDRQLPDGSMDEPAYEALTDAFGFVHERADVVRGTEHVPETAVLHALSTVNGADGRRFSLFEDRMRQVAPFEGAAGLLIEHGRHFTAMNEEALPESIDDYRLIIVPEQEELPRELVGGLESYVRGGGRLLITQSGADGGVDEGLLELAGLRFSGFASTDYGYVGARTPVAVRGRFARTEVAHAAEVLPYVVPLGAGDPAKKFGHGLAPPSGRGDFPAVTSRTLGRGEVVYVAAPAFRSYYDYPSHLLAEVLLGLVDRLLPDPIARLTAPPHVEMVLARREADLFIHLVNHSGKDMMSRAGVPVMFHTPEIRDIRLAVRLEAAPASLRLAPSGEELPCAAQGGYAEVTVPRLRIMQTVCVPDYFA